MRRFTRLAQKQADLGNDAQMDPIVKKSRPENKTSNIVTLDNGTMVEAFKYLTYMQLAKCSLVSKRYSNLICTHRHSLALLYVDSIFMSENYGYAVCIKIFNNVFSPKAYSEWIIRNQYTKQIPQTDQFAENQSEQYEMRADYTDSNKTPCVFVAQVKLNHENWPLFQHFVRLLTDPFIYIRYLELTTRIDVSFINLLAEAMSPDYDRLQCDKLVLVSNRNNRVNNVLKFISWTKNYVYCNKFRICHYSGSNYDEELIDLFVTGARCTSEITITNCDLYNVFKVLSQIFKGLKSRDEYQMVESIHGDAENQGVVEVLKRNLAEFIAEEEEQYEEGYSTTQIIGFINNDIKKKLTLSVKHFPLEILSSFSIKITNL